MIQITYYFFAVPQGYDWIMSLAERNSSMQPRMFGSFQAEIDRMLEKVGMLVCEEEEEEYVALTEEIEKIVVEETHTQTAMKLNAHSYTKYPALIHGKYSIPKTWVKDEDVARVVIQEDGNNRRFLRTTKDVAYYLYKELAI